ncbi:MAG TPA: hypothetical protein PK357_01680 [Candidatus Pacearchaeota archaeon]|nr:hypothetical protein [Candidatus Pacearchaeota archaeon]
MNSKNKLEKGEGYLSNYHRFGKFIILEFTKELIRNHAPEEILNIKSSLQEKQIFNLEVKEEEKIFEFIPEKVHQKIVKEEKMPEILKQEKPIIVKEEKIPTFAIPVKKEEPSLIKKEWFQKRGEDEKTIKIEKEKDFPNMQIYRKPLEYSQNKESFRELKIVIPETRFPPHIQYIKPVPINKEIDLGKLNPLINDRFVKIIECYGPNENLFVKGSMGIKKTGIALTDEEIKKIINKFSEETKIPANEGIFKVASGKLMFSAIISETIGSKFIISKIPPEQAENYRI